MVNFRMKAESAGLDIQILMHLLYKKESSVIFSLPGYRYMAAKRGIAFLIEVLCGSKDLMGYINFHEGHARIYENKKG